MSNLKEIPMSAITVSKHNPRKVLTNDPAVRELADSIASSGLLQPVICRPLSGGEFELLAGSRRYAAHVLLDRETILAIVTKLSDAEAIRVTVLENLQRQNLTPMEEARGVKELLDAGQDIKQVATDIGRSVQWVARRKALCGLSPKWIELLEKGETSIAHAELACVYPIDEQERLSNVGWMLESGRAHQFAELLARESHKLSAAPWGFEECLPGPGEVRMACSVCSERSGMQPDLFAENGQVADKDDTCLNAHCWDAKAKVFLARAEEDARKKHPNLVKVATAHDETRELDCFKSCQFEKVKKSAPGAVPALVVHGPDQGKVIFVKLDSDAAKTKTTRTKGEDGKVSLADRRVQLGMRRKAWVVKHVAKVLEKSALNRDDTVCPIDGKPNLLIALAAKFGTDIRQEAILNPKTEWGGAENFHKCPEIAARELWRMVAGVLQLRLRIWQVSGCDQQYAEAMEIASLLAMPKQAVLMEDAVAAIPEPQSWAKEEAVADLETNRKGKKS